MTDIMTPRDPHAEAFAAGYAKCREDALSAVRPKGDRPCHCKQAPDFEGCDCGNRDDAFNVGLWDGYQGAYEAIRALTPPPAPAPDADAGVSDAEVRVALDAWDDARCLMNSQWHGSKCEPMSARNKHNVFPMMRAALEAVARHRAGQTGEPT